MCGWIGCAKIFHIKKKYLLLVIFSVRLNNNKNGRLNTAGGKFCEDLFIFSIGYMHPSLRVICRFLQPNGKMEWRANCYA